MLQNHEILCPPLQRPLKHSYHFFQKDLSLAGKHPHIHMFLPRFPLDNPTRKKKKKTTPFHPVAEPVEASITTKKSPFPLSLATSGKEHGLN